jgi:hypothetical protein
MQAALGLSVHAVISRVQPLVRKGYLVEISGPGTSHRYRATDAGLAELGLRRCAHCHGNGTVPKEEP